MIRSCMCCAICTGFLSGDKSNTRSLAWCTSRCLVWHRHIWLMTSTSSPTAAAAFSDQQLTGHVVPHTHNIFSERSFAAASPRVWNNLPSQLRQNVGCGQFKQQLKTFLFLSELTTAHCDCLLICALEILLLTYLLTYLLTRTLKT